MKKIMIIFINTFIFVNIGGCNPLISKSPTTKCSDIPPTSCQNGYVVYLSSCTQTPPDSYNITFAQPKYNPIIDNKGNPVQCKIH